MEKGILIDCGRRYWAYESLCRLLDLMALNGFNHLQLHFSDNEGFRIECRTFPEITSEQHLTYQEIQNLMLYAKEREIEIIPELDMPGHLGHILQYFPQFCLPKGDVFDKTALNVLSDDAISFITQILTEYMTLFASCQYFHIGADEFIPFDDLTLFPQLQRQAKRYYGEEASGLEPYIAFVNQIVARLTSAGFQVRIWNDGFYRADSVSQLSLTQDVEITYWTQWHQGMAKPEVWLDKGYRLVNFNDNYLYYVLGEKAGYQYPQPSKIASDFHILKFSGEYEISPRYLSNISGAYLSVWADVAGAQSDQMILKKLETLLPALGQKL